ncbi:MAG: DUF4831 family protein [Culturomica sp.]|nr:DUF4831 family protein [Culturomica sp.]
MKRIYVICLLLLTGFSATVAQKKKELSLPVTVHYCLPKVSFRVTAVLECTRLIPGPFRQDAERELGIRAEITEPGELWRVAELQIRPEYLPDEQAVYSVTASGDYAPVMLSLSPEGFLAGVSSGSRSVPREEWHVKYTLPVTAEEHEEEVDLTALKVYNPLKEVLDTNYIVQEIDGVEKKIWDPIVRYEKRTHREVMQGAVREIFRIKSEREKLVAGEGELPVGASLKTVLKELDRMEQEYFSLFLGKKEVYTIERTFSVLPGKEEEPVAIFRFSETEGVVERQNVTAVVYSLVVEQLSIPASGRGAAAPAAAIYYRVPATGEVKLINSFGELQRFRAVIPQEGTIQTLPAEVIANEGWTVEFHPEYGSLKSITKR